MKLISLNTWGGKLYKPLINFIKKNDADIFCFQEVYDTYSKNFEYLGYRLNLYLELSKILNNHTRYFAPILENYLIGSRTEIKQTDFNVLFGQAIFVKKEVKVKLNGDLFVFGSRNSVNPNNLNSIPRTLQYITFEKDGKDFIVCNIHGVWNKEGKNDTPSRIKQSQIIIDFLNKQKGGKILCGDFNLNPGTKSIQMLEENFDNLIKKYKIDTTRNTKYPGKEKFADYTFISNDINIKSFSVPKVKISDHLPLILEFVYN